MHAPCLHGGSANAKVAYEPSPPQPQLTAAGGFRDLEGDSSLDELDDVGAHHHHHHHHHGSHYLPALLPVSTDVSGSSSPTRFGGQDSPTLQQVRPA